MENYKEYLLRIDKKIKEEKQKYGLYSEGFFLNRDKKYLIKKSIEEKYPESEKENMPFLKSIEDLHKKNEEIITQNQISNLIDLMGIEEICKEIEGIKNYDRFELEKIGEFFESNDIFPNFGLFGIKHGHMKIILFRLDELSKIDLSIDS